MGQISSSLDEALAVVLGKPVPESLDGALAYYLHEYATPARSGPELFKQKVEAVRRIQVAARALQLEMDRADAAIPELVSAGGRGRSIRSRWAAVREPIADMLEKAT